MSLFDLFGKPPPPDITGDSSKSEKGISASPVMSGSGGWYRILEADTGNWQKNIEVDHDAVRFSPTVYSAMTMIASDIAKLRVKLVQMDASGVWREIENAAYSPVLRKPNRMQNRIQFWEHYMLAKLSTGNVYVLKERDARGVVKALYVLNPTRVVPLVTDLGDVYYQLSSDNIAGITGQIVAPASEIIHDRMNTIYHPLVGTSPLHAAGVAAMQGLKIEQASANFFANGARPSGIVVAPGRISDETADRLKAYWNSQFSGENSGRVAILGDGLTYQPMTMKATDAQTVELLKMSIATICDVFHIPFYKICSQGGQPKYNNVQNLNIEYYSQCLQQHIEAAELCLDEGLGLDAYSGARIGTEFDLDGLMRMDTKTQVEILSSAKDFMTLNERRMRFDLEGKPYGNTIYMQEQDHSAEAISARDKLIVDGESHEPKALEVAPDPAIKAAESRAFAAEALLAMRKSLEMS